MEYMSCGWNTACISRQQQESTQLALVIQCTYIVRTVRTFPAGNKWSDSEKSLFFIADMKRGAQRVVQHLSDVERSSYDSIVKVLNQRCASDDLAERHAMVLAQRCQKPDESLQELGDACRRLFTQAYPEAEEKLKDRLMKKAFIEMIADDKIQRLTARGDTRTLEEAVHLATEATRPEVAAQENRRLWRTTEAVPVLHLPAPRPYGKRLPQQDRFGKRAECRPRGRRAGTGGVVQQPRKIHLDGEDEGSPYVIGKMGGKEYACLLDTGATKSIIITSATQTGTT